MTFSILGPVVYLEANTENELQQPAFLINIWQFLSALWKSHAKQNHRKDDLFKYILHT